MRTRWVKRDSPRPTDHAVRGARRCPVDQRCASVPAKIGTVPFSLAAAVVVGVAAIAMFIALPRPTPGGDTPTKQNAAETFEANSGGTSSPKATGKADAKKETAKEQNEKEVIEPADNSYCLVCHLNYENEKLTTGHQIAGVGCMKCHGDSKKHSGDEDGLTPPDVLFAREDVDNFCITCHPKDKIIKSEYHKDLFPAKPGEGSKKAEKHAATAEADEHLFCTECHGENHRMEVRTRKWDKKTRKLIADDGVRMMYKDSPATEGVSSTPKKRSD